MKPGTGTAGAGPAGTSQDAPPLNAGPADLMPIPVAVGRAHPDLGRLAMVPAAAVILLLDVAGLAHRAAHGTLGVLQGAGALLVCAFYALIIWCYLRRGPAVATSSSRTAHAAALLATWGPFAIPLLGGARPGLAQQAIADALMVLGMGWAVWSLRFLGRNVSVLAQARGIVDTGPYRWLRHPLYAGEIVSSLGLAITADSAAAVAVWLGICFLQAYRAAREEQVLLGALPGYAEYRSRTAALVPGVF